MARLSDPDDAPIRQSRRSLRSANRQPERAQFLARFADHDELEPAVSAFVNGNYRDVRIICSQLLESEVDPEVHDAARELLRRIEPDRLILTILWGSFVLLALIVLWAYGHG
jgi:hypothetical protein